jgi:lipopolysaccharide cholinephosphotransferase
MKTVIKDKATLLENLVIARDLLGQKGIPLFLHFGTLLGALREKDFIPHDDDADVGLYERDEAAFLSSFDELAEKGLSFLERIPAMRLYSFVRGGEQLDFFIAREKRSIFGRRWDLEGRATVPARHLDSLDEIDFLGQRFKVPHDPYGLVRNLYGRTWDVPLANRPSRLDWGTRARKALRNPGKLWYYLHRFITKRAGWARIARRAKRGESGNINDPAARIKE